MTKLPEKKLAEELNDFINKYLERGIGGYSGRELELLVLDLILKTRSDISKQSIFEKSKTLKATESKIKNMIYEISLRNNTGNQILIDHIEKNLKSAEFEKGRIIIEIDDVYCQKKLKSILKENGYITDSSFNSDLVKIPYEGFIDIVSELFPDKIGQAKFKDLLETKKLASSNREILRGIEIPGTKFKSGELWDVAVSLGGSVRAAIELKIENLKNKTNK